MTAFTHIAATAVAARMLQVPPSQLWLAYLFGTLIDLDHLPVEIFYLLKTGSFRSYLKGHYITKKLFYWGTPLQEPVSLLWVVPLCLFLGTFVPLFFFLFHMSLDYIQFHFVKKPFFPFSNFKIVLPFMKMRVISEALVIFLLLWIVKQQQLTFL